MGVNTQHAVDKEFFVIVYLCTSYHKAQSSIQMRAERAVVRTNMNSVEISKVVFYKFSKLAFLRLVSINLVRVRPVTFTFVSNTKLRGWTIDNGCSWKYPS